MTALLSPWIINGRITDLVSADDELPFAVVIARLEAKARRLRLDHFDREPTRHRHQRGRVRSVLVLLPQNFLVGPHRRDVLERADRDIHATGEVEPGRNVGRDMPEVADDSVGADRLPEREIPLAILARGSMPRVLADRRVGFQQVRRVAHVDVQRVNRPIVSVEHVPIHSIFAVRRNPGVDGVHRHVVEEILAEALKRARRSQNRIRTDNLVTVHEPIAKTHDVATDTEFPRPGQDLAQLVNVTGNEVVDAVLELEMFLTENRAAEVPALRAIGALEEVNADVLERRGTAGDGEISRNRHILPKTLVVGGFARFDGERRSGRAFVLNKRSLREHIAEVHGAAKSRRTGNFLVETLGRDPESSQFVTRPENHRRIATQPLGEHEDCADGFENGVLTGGKQNSQEGQAVTNEFETFHGGRKNS